MAFVGEVCMCFCFVLLCFSRIVLGGGEEGVQKKYPAQSFD